MRSKVLLAIIFIVIFCSGCVTTNSAEYVLNTDFEQIHDGKPVSWTYVYGDSNGYTITLDPDTKWQGEYALRIEAEQDTTREWAAGIVESRLPIWFKMRDMRLRGYIKREGVEELGYAGMWARIDRQNGFPRFQEQSAYNAPATQDWTWYEVSLTLDEEVRELAFGGILRGGGRVWFDSLTLDVDGIPYPVAAEQATEAVRGIWQQPLEKALRPWSGPQTPAFRARLREQPLTTLWLADDGLQSPLTVAKQIWQTGEFDYLAVLGNHAAIDLLLQEGEQSFPSLDSTLSTFLPNWVASRELGTWLGDAARQGQLVGIDLGLPEPALTRLAPYSDAFPDWDELDSLHRRLIYQIGRELINEENWQRLNELTQRFKQYPLPDEVIPAREFLQSLMGFYANNGSSRYRDTYRIAQLRDLLDRPDSPRVLLLISGVPSAKVSGSWVSKLHRAFADESLQLGVTVGTGEVLRDPTSGARVPLARLAPYCHEYYLSEVSVVPAWLDLASNSQLWVPRQMFIRAHTARQRGTPFVTVNLRESFDVLLFFPESGAATPW